MTLFELYLNQARINIQPHHGWGTCTSRAYRGSLMYFIIVLFRAVRQRLTSALQSHAPRGLKTWQRGLSLQVLKLVGGVQPTKACRTGQGASCFTDQLLLVYQYVHRHLKPHQLIQILIVNESFHSGCDASLLYVSWRENCIFREVTAHRPTDSQSLFYFLGASGSPSSVEGNKTCRPATPKLIN